MIIRVELPGELKLFEIGFAIHDPGFIFCATQGWQKQSRKNGNNGDDDEQLDECESVA